MIVARSGDDYDWTNDARPVCSGDPRPRWEPTASGEKVHEGDAGVSSDAGDAGVSGAADAGTESGAPINAAKVLSEMRPGFRDCYKELLKRNRAAQGSVRLTLRVNCEGYVSSIHGTLHGGLDEGTARCVFAVAKDARFERPRGRGALVRVPVNFMRASPTATP